MENLSDKQKLKVKGSIVDTNNRLNGIFRFFDPFNSEFYSGSRLVDLLSNCFFFFGQIEGTLIPEDLISKISIKLFFML